MKQTEIIAERDRIDEVINELTFKIEEAKLGYSRLKFYCKQNGHPNSFNYYVMGEKSWKCPDCHSYR